MLSFLIKETHFLDLLAASHEPVCTIKKVPET